MCLFPLLCCNALHTSSSIAMEWIGSLCPLQLTESRVLFSKGCTDRAHWQYDKRSLPSNPPGDEDPCPSTVLLTSVLSLFPPSFLFGMLDGHFIFPNSLLPFHYKAFIFACAGAMSFRVLVGRYLERWKIWWRGWQQWRFCLQIALVSQLSQDSDINERHKRTAWMWQTNTLSVAFVFLICLHFWN